MPDLDDLAVPAKLAGFAAAHLKHPDGVRRIAEMILQDTIVAALPEHELIDCALALRRAAPGDRFVWALTNRLLHSQVPAWHWKMVQDTDRNGAYATAIAACIGPGMTVLEIGAGTGLLAMLAARAGADHVYTIEMNARMARIARDCIAANGLSDRVTVLEMMSTDVKVGSHLPRRCDVLIHEILSTNLLQERVIPAVADARERLLVPDAPLLPDTIWATGTLSEAMARVFTLPDRISDLDLSPLDALAPASALATDADPARHLSKPLRLVEFDMRNVAARARGIATMGLCATRAGVASGIAQWIGMSFPDNTTFEATQPNSCWGTFFHPFGSDCRVNSGDVLNIEVCHLPSTLAIGLAGDSHRRAVKE